jgi:hypothetical protein
MTALQQWPTADEALYAIKSAHRNADSWLPAGLDRIRRVRLAVGSF